ncbi:MAG: prepilin-type N-terminal cleavage/methylation domain-containing protein [candidate division Zixibacteria bacterium]|nr:prepilin-type N-terminal cleavage/methylation domain-containing protein [candidate division Zixibacteria bacterium]
MMRPLSDKSGFTLIELVMVIVIVGILAGVATVQLSRTTESARHEATQVELDALAAAIVGDPTLTADGARSDFGYVGDVGAMPPTLDALASNPGFATWRGPYIKGDFAAGDFLKDGWNVAYTYQDTLLRSTGSGANIDKIFASDRTVLLSNSIIGYVRDASHRTPGTVYRDSVAVIVTYPNGTGGMASPTTAPDAGGRFAFSGVPIGNHRVRIIYRPDSDTVTIPVCVLPGATTKLDVNFPADLW